LATLLPQLDVLAKKIKEFELLYKKKYRYIPPHERRKPKDYEGGQVEAILSPILHKVEDHDIVLKEMSENVSMLNQMSASHRISIELLVIRMVILSPILNSSRKEGLPSDPMANPKNETRMRTSVVPRC